MPNSNKNNKQCAPVLIIFFNRPETVKKVFEQVRKAKPSILLLYQDGPRNESDKEKIEKCRQIFSNIDWECKIYMNFQKKNVGCDPSEYIAQKWAFSIVDKCIVLEDDDVPSESFFSFCTEMLAEYEFDNRISIISGMNHFGTYKENEMDYIFTKNISIWGWASWKRVVDNWDTSYSKYICNKKAFIKKYKRDYPMRVLSKAIDSHIKSGKEHYETILIYNHLVNDQLAIVPTKNMIVNIGNNPEGGTHSSTSIEKLPNAIKSIFLLNTYTIDTIRKNNIVVEDKKYSKKVYKLMGWSNPLSKYKRKIEVLLKRGKCRN